MNYERVLVAPSNYAETKYPFYFELLEHKYIIPEKGTKAQQV